VIAASEVRLSAAGLVDMGVFSWTHI